MSERDRVLTEELRADAAWIPLWVKLGSLPLHKNGEARLQRICERLKAAADELDDLRSAPPAGAERRFPIQGAEGLSVPWGEAEIAYRTYSKLFGTQQTLERIAERGGFSISEYAAFRFGFDIEENGAIRLGPQVLKPAELVAPPAGETQADGAIRYEDGNPHESHRWVGAGDYGGHVGGGICADCGCDIEDDEALKPCPAGETQEPVARPEIVCICGSTRFADQHAVKRWELEREGEAIVLMINYLPAWYADEQGWNGHDHYGEIAGNKDLLDELHFRKIDLADRVIVICPGGYIGESTAHEIAYAQSQGKPVEYDDRGVPLRQSEPVPQEQEPEQPVAWRHMTAHGWVVTKTKVSGDSEPLVPLKRRAE